jgi:hypothetical protein
MMRCSVQMLEVWMGRSQNLTKAQDHSMPMVEFGVIRRDISHGQAFFYPMLSFRRLSSVAHTCAPRPKRFRRDNFVLFQMQ